MYPTIILQVQPSTEHSDENYFDNICGFHSGNNSGSGVMGFIL
jgi:hypothetical protein